jgi:hypothetical protein
MTIVEYILDPQDKPRSYYPKTIPSYITDGGYWGNPDGSEKMIGVGLEGSIPDDATTFTLAELQARQRAIHVEYPMKKDPNVRDSETRDLTDDEVDAVIKEWVDARS